MKPLPQKYMMRIHTKLIFYIYFSDTRVMQKLNFLVDLDKMENEMIDLENKVNVINFDPNASFAYNKFISEYGHNIKIAPIYKNDRLIGACYVELQNEYSHIRYLIQGGIIYLDGFKDAVEEFIDKNFSQKNLCVRYVLFQQLNFERLHKIKHLPRTTLIPIKETEEEQRKLLIKGRRRDITKAVKLELVVRELNDIQEWEEMFNLLKELSNYRSYDLDINMDLLKVYYKELYPKRIAIAFGCFKGKDMIAVDLVLFSKNRGREKIIAEKPDQMNTGAQSYLIWETINYCRKNNIKYLDLAGTPPEYSYMQGISNFKNSFGGDSLNIQIYDENSIKRLMQNIKLSPLFLKFQRIYKSKKV